MMKAARPHVKLVRSALAAAIRVALFVLLMGWMGIGTASGQVVDTVRTVEVPAADSVAAQAIDSIAVSTADSIAAQRADSFAVAGTTARTASEPVRAAVGFADHAYGVAIMDTLPVRHPALDLSDLLGELPGAFIFRFDLPGWPEGWSPGGLPPQHATVALNDAPFTHVFTGRPAFDITPMAFIEAPRRAAHRFHRPAVVSIRTRSFATARPLTEMKYWKGGDGLESIDVVHAQNRRLSLFGTAGVFNVIGTYSGRGADGEYPGSELHRGRQVQLRLRYDRPGWSAEMHEMHTRRTIGAHGGVIPDNTGFESIYRRVAATVENPEARRRLIRNDLTGTVRLRLFDSVTTLGAFWTAEMFRYRDVADTAGTASDRLGLRLRQPLPGGLALEVDGWVDRIAPRYRFAAAAVRRTELHAVVRDSVALLGWTASAAGGAHAYDGVLRPGGFIDVFRVAGPFALRAGASLSGTPSSAVETMGFLALGASPTDRASTITEAFAEIGWRGGPFDVSVRGFGSRTTDPRDIYMAADYQAVPDSASVRTASSSIIRVGASLDIGWRRSAGRGFYGLLQPSAVRFVNAGDSDLHTRTARALPEFFGRARLGARYLLFRGDLDLDIHLEAHAWSSTTGRALHPETGLLAIPMLGALPFGPSSAIDLGVEAGVREATLFLIYQNVLAGTVLMPGNLLVPVYPLPAQQFRFGVYWPIFD